jgi:anti-sigma regulatory factor (Ser/Thr protein kinase)
MDEALDTPDLAAAVQAEQTHLRIPSRPEWIGPTVEFLRRKAVLCGACPAAEGGRLEVALHEALSNSVIHGNLEIPSALKEQGPTAFIETLAARAADPRYARRVVEIQVQYDGDHCRWVLTDEGPGFDVAAVLRRLEQPDAALLPSGRGILLMRAFLDGVEYCAGGRQVHLTLNQAPGGEKRRDPRRRLHEPVRVVPVRDDGTVDWDAAQAGVARNLSAGGVAVLQARLAGTGRVLIALGGGDPPIYLPAEVRHWRALGEYEVEVGCRFQLQPPAPPPAPAPDLEAALAGLQERLGTRPASDERRAHPRLPYTGRVEVLATAQAEPAWGFARDLSRGGVAFLTTRPLALGERVLELPQGPGAPRLRVRAQISRCTAIMEGFYDVAARFLGLA